MGNDTYGFCHDLDQEAVKVLDKKGIALCEHTELGAEECKAIAEMYRSRRRPEEALSRVERGLEIARSDSPRSHTRS